MTFLFLADTQTWTRIVGHCSPSISFRRNGTSMVGYVRLSLFLVVFDACSSLGLGEQSTHEPCLQTESALVILCKDPLSGNFSVVHRMKPGVSPSVPGILFRKLEQLDRKKESNDTTFLRNQFHRTGNEALEAEASRGLQAGEFWNDLPNFDPDDELYYAWECSCHEDLVATVYCPLDIMTCFQPIFSSTGELSGCRNLPRAYEFRRYIFLFIAISLVPLITSKLGASLFGFISSQCFPSRNERVVNRLIERHPDQVQDMIQRCIVREQRELLEARRREVMRRAGATHENTTNSGTVRQVLDETHDVVPEDPPTSLVLRTKMYRATVKIPPEDQADTCSKTEEDQCAICFLSFEDGDKVGLLKRTHLFHTDCLKLWLQRRNACPLCQAKDIAVPRYEEIFSVTAASTTHVDDAVISASEEAPSA